MPHLDAAYNLARWLTRNEHDASDVVQESFLRAFKFFGGFRGTNARSWLLAIVRNASYSWLEKNRKSELNTVFDEELHGLEANPNNLGALLPAQLEEDLVRKTIEELPAEFREIIVLRELEELSYKEIAELAQIPIGTVMSRLARARKQLQTLLNTRLGQERAI
jgi:RNA polymerase sigma-70 factor (ECF subfamily)